MRDEKLEIRPLCPAFGAQVVGVDLTQSIDGDLYSRIHAAFLQHQLLLFRDQDLPEANQVRYGTVFSAEHWLDGMRDTIGPRLEVKGESLYYPLSVDIGPDGRLYVLDAGNSRIVVFSQEGAYLTQFGSGDLVPFDFGTGQRFGDGLDFAGSIAVDDEGFIYVADVGNLRIQKFAP